MEISETSLFTGIFTLLGTLIGGFITYKATANATKENHKNNLELLDKKDKSDEQILISSLWTELSELKKLFIREFEEKLIKNTSDKFEWGYPEGTDYFTVFNTSANKLGQIKNDDLRNKIIATYIEAKFFYDSLKTNTQLLNKRSKLNLEFINAPQISEPKITLPRILENLEEVLKLSKSTNLVPSYHRLFSMLDEIEAIIDNNKNIH